MSIEDNIARIRERIAEASQRAGRVPESVQLMAITKMVDGAQIAEAHEAGVRLFGENRVQEFAGKRWDVHRLEGAEWRLVGHLQSNKAMKAVELFSAIDSVDSLKLAETLNGVAQRLRRRVPILLEINIGEEETKHGLAPHSPELEQLLTAMPRLAGLELRGLMAIPPPATDPEQARPYFRRMRVLCEAIGARNLPAVSMAELSLGMSGDFEVAVEEGSTCVRLGTAIFGARG